MIFAPLLATVRAMSRTDETSLPLDLTLVTESGDLDGGTPARVPGTEATAELTGTAVRARIALSDRSRAEQRWMVDQLMRKLTGLVSIDRATVAAAPGVDDDSLETIALDLHNRFDGKLTVTGPDGMAARVARVGAVEDLYRAWVDEDPATRTSIAIANDVDAWAADRPDVEVTVLDREALREAGLRLLLAVGQGSEVSPPRLVIARYTPGGKSDKPLMLLGKGITFDSGGINVKPYDSFVSMMKNDMAGSALAFSLFTALVEAGHPEPLLLVISTCENAIGAASMRPGAIVQSYRGHKVRIDHTDAEGRLALADGLAYASDKYEPGQIVCFATLTTAALIAYGPYATPVHFAPPALEASLRQASESTGEDLHFFPERLWHFEANRDKEADLRNTARLPGNAVRGAGSRNAAHFLKHFTERPLCHLDIFASTWNWAGDAPGAGYGATGAPLRTLLRALSPS
jgi:leucyl aminopeptidase